MTTVVDPPVEAVVRSSVVELELELSPPLVELDAVAVTATVSSPQAIRSPETVRAVRTRESRTRRIREG